MCFVNRVLVFLSLFPLCISAGSQDTSIAPGTRSIMDAHNCYPYFEWWADRIDRAISTSMPLSIEQDPFWYTDRRTGRSGSVIAHGTPVTGQEPTLEQYFFERIRSVIEAALRSGN